jgi:hypothetical protein
MQDSQRPAGPSSHAGVGPEDLVAAEGLDAAIVEMRRLVDAPPAPDLTGGIMSRIERLEDQGQPVSAGGLWRRVRDAWFAPRRVSFSIRPISAVAAAVVVAVAVAVAGGWRASDAPTRAGESSSPGIFVQFRLHAPEAASVRLAGSFTGWQPQHEMHEATPGVWTLTLSLPPGVHDYSFVVNEHTWVTDPHALGVDDGFGGTASRMALLAPDSSPS